MPEGKTKQPARKSKTKATRAPKLISASQTKSRAGLVSASAKKRPSLKRSPAKSKIAVNKRVVRKNAPTSKPGVARKPLAAALQPSRALTPLPKPLEILPQPGYSYTSRVRLQHTTAPHRWSLRHNLFTILALTLVGAMALTIVASYAQLTFEYIEIYSANQSSILKPVSLTEQSFSLDAGTFTITYPEDYAVSTSSTDAIEWQYTAEPTTTAQLRVHRNESDNVFTWLQQNQPDYSSAKVISPSAAVAEVDGILVEAQSADDYDVLVAYWPYQKNLAEKYIVELMLVIDPNAAASEMLADDLDTFVSGIEISD